MSLQADRNWIKTEIDQVSDPYFMETLKSLFNYRRQSQSDKEVIVAYTTAGDPLTLKQYNARLEKAEKQVANGQVISHEALGEKMKKW